jgi:hypothetical protein
MMASKDCESAASGSDTGGNGSLHEPHRPLLLRYLAGIRFATPQDGHNRVIE